VGKIHISRANIMNLCTKEYYVFCEEDISSIFVGSDYSVKKSLHLNIILELLQISQRSFRRASFTISAISELVILCIAPVIFNLYI
jgi:hypothetical protein